MIKSYVRCECGAITVYAGKKSYSCKAENLRRFFPDLDLSVINEDNKVKKCNHCVNHYGLDLCACGSGEPYETCASGFDICGKPMQSLERGYNRVCSQGAIGMMDRDVICAGALRGETDTGTPYSPPKDLGVDLGKQIMELKAMEEKVQSTLNGLITAITEKIRNTEIPGVVPISKAPVCFMMSFRTIAENGRVNLSAEYYSGELQANLVEKVLAVSMKNGSVNGVLDKLMEITDKQSVTVNKTTYALNLTTVRILKDACRSVGMS